MSVSTRKLGPNPSSSTGKVYKTLKFKITGQVQNTVNRHHRPLKKNEGETRCTQLQIKGANLNRGLAPGCEIPSDQGRVKTGELPKA